ncbi:hypothetical protein DRN75_04105 [Nanoarchaeota archaeon]|nr:MAG: hypothetical protein DRN75_04105 [Nanoarchaeota archaeon]
MCGLTQFVDVNREAKRRAPGGLGGAGSDAELRTSGYTHRKTGLCQARACLWHARAGRDRKLLPRGDGAKSSWKLK